VIRLFRRSIQLFRVILPVNDISKAAEFYTFLLNQKGERVSHGRHYFRCVDVILACYDSMADGDEIETPSNPDYVYFASDDLDELFV
jgi:hypothetical protein